MSVRQWFANIFQRNTYSNFEWWMRNFGNLSQDEVVVTPLTALRANVVMSCVRIISNTIASLPLRVYMDTPTGKETAFTHDQFYLLGKEPNLMYSSFTFRATLIMYYLLWGNAYAEIIRNQFGRPIRYDILKSGDVMPEIVDGVVIYKYKDRIIDASNMIHLSDMNLDGVIGMSRIELAKDSISMILSGTTFGKNFYKNGTHIGGILEFQKTLKAEDIAKYKSSFKSVNGGLNNSGEVAILDQGTKYVPHKPTMPLADAQYIESQHFQVADIARIFNVPPHKVGDLNKSSFNNIEQQAIEYVENCILPICVMFEQEFDRKIFRPKERGQYYVKLELKGLLRGDLNARGEYQAKMFDRGVFSINDIRRLEDMNEVENGDNRYVPMNFTTIEKSISNETEG